MQYQCGFTNSPKPPKKPLLPSMHGKGSTRHKRRAVVIQHQPQWTCARTTCQCTHSRSSNSKLTSVLFVYCNLMSLTTRRCIVHFYTQLQVHSHCCLTLSLNAHRYSSSQSKLSRKNNGMIYLRLRCRFKPSAPVSRWMRAKRKYWRQIWTNMMSWWTHAISPSRKR